MRKRVLTVIDSIADILIKVTPKYLHNSKTKHLKRSSLKASQYVIINLEDRTYFGNHPNETIEHLASINKVLIARALLEQIHSKKLNMSDPTPQFQTNYTLWDVIGKDIKENLSYMLNQSSNTATNVITEALGGYSGINESLRLSGLIDSSINCYTEPSSYVPSPPISRNISTPYELGIAMIDIVQSGNMDFIQPMIETEYPYTHTHRVCNKAGINSTTIANVSLIKVDNREYVIVVFFKLTRLKVKVFTLLSEILSLQKSQNILFKWDPVSAFTQKAIKYLHYHPL
jgi:Beta-lactamase enzyme family